MGELPPLGGTTMSELYPPSSRLNLVTCTSVWCYTIDIAGTSSSGIFTTEPLMSTASQLDTQPLRPTNLRRYDGADGLEEALSTV